MVSTAQAFSERWQQAQRAESSYWDHTARDAAEFLRIFYLKQLCLNVIQMHVPRAVTPCPGRRKRVVEIGVGPLGVGLCCLLEGADDWERIGVEPQARRQPHLPNIPGVVYRSIKEIPMSYIQAMGEDTGLREGSFDLALCYNVLDHTPNWRGILREIARLVKPGGYFVLSVDTLSVLSRLRWKYWQRFVHKHDPYILAHPCRFTGYELAAMLPAHGFKVLWMEEASCERLRRLIGKARRLMVVGLKSS